MKHLSLKQFTHIFISIVALVVLVSCHESIEDRAARECREFTEKKCPTPMVNNTITDSLVFDKGSRTYITFLTFCNEFDNADMLKENEQKLYDQMLQNIRSDAGVQKYIEVGFNFRYVCRSKTDPNLILLDLKYSSDVLRK